MAAPQRPEAGASGIRVPCLTEIDEPTIREHLADNRFFWLDLDDPAPDAVTRLGDLFGFHPLALEDTIHFGQRPKLDEYDDHVLLVFYGVVGRKPREVHLYLSGQWLVSVHRGALPALEVERDRLDQRLVNSEQFLVYRVVDALTDSFFPMLATIDDEIEDLEEVIVADPEDECLRRLFDLRRELVTLRKIITPQRDIFARSIDRISALPGLVVEERDYFRDVYDHLIRMSDLVDSYRDLLTGGIDLYLSTVANRQNEVMKQLAIVGTIFLPLSFITGFFGQNFGWLVNHALTGLWSFLALGIGSLVMTCAVLIVFFRRKGWL